jgi:hypothetical protein
MSTAIRRALYGRLAGDTTLTSLLATPVAGYAQSIFYQRAPENSAYPLVVISKSSGVPTDTFGLAGAFETDVWLVKGIARDASADTVEAIQARIQTLLNDAPLSISGQTLMALRRQSDVDYPEIADGETYRHAGALYRVIHEQS